MATFPSFGFSTPFPDQVKVYDDPLIISPVGGKDIPLSDNKETVTSLILSSTPYKEAYSILSSDTRYGSSYLSLLQMIPYSHEVRDINFWDGVTESFGGTSGYVKAVKDAFNAAMDDIRSLMQDYYSFLSKLPSEQVNQLRDAGINAAVTGEGVTPSSMTSPDPASMISSNPSQSEYSNTALSDGITSFVEFIGSMVNLGSAGVNAKNLLGLLDIAEREGYNKQETHDLLMANLGVTTSSPYRVLTGDNTPVVNTLSSTARLEQRVKSAEVGATAKALDSPISVSVGDDPNSVQTYEVMSGEDWLSEVSRFQIANRFADVMIKNIRLQSDQLYSGVLSTLENEYHVANFAAQTSQANFNEAYFSSRDGVLEGVSESNMLSYLTELRRNDAYIRSIDAWKEDYRSGILAHWGQQLEQRPYLAPYFYKAMFDFNMEDTFYHQNPTAQGLKYGLKAVESIGSFIGHLTGFKSPTKMKGKTVRQSGPNGDTVTETINHYQ